jgi:hypothetical protein
MVKLFLPRDHLDKLLGKHVNYNEKYNSPPKCIVQSSCERMLALIALAKVLETIVSFSKLELGTN